MKSVSTNSVERRACELACLGIACAALAHADTVSDSIDAFRTAAFVAQPGVAQAGKFVFVSLAVIGGGWEMIQLRFAGASVNDWGAGMIRIILWILTFWMLMLYGPSWTTAIVASLQLVGAGAAGVAELSPSGILGLGHDLAALLLTGSKDFGFFSGEWVVGLVMAFSAVAIFFAFVLMAVQYAITLVLWYIVGSLGVIFLGFGGSRWTAPYTERYFSMAIAIGIKFLTLLFIVGIGLNFGPALLGLAKNAPASASPGLAALGILAISGLYCVAAWKVPAIFSTMMSGSPAFGASDFWGALRTVASAAMAGVGVVSTAVGGAVAAGAALGGTAGGAAAPVTSAGSGSVPPPGGNGGGGGAGGGGSGKGAPPPQWTGVSPETLASAQASQSGGSTDGAGAGGSAAGGGGSSGGGASGGGGGGNGWAVARARAQRTLSHTANTLNGLSQDGGGYGAGPPIHMG
jgi:P-type conjugative transfer protein TrbL